ncbi:MAG: sugar kinase [Albidovulum sp.]
MTAPLKIGCIGEAMIELAFEGETPLVGFAGDALNTAVYLRRSLPAKHSVSFVSVVGTDPFSGRMLDFIGSQGVLTTDITQHQGLLPGLYAIDTTADGERSFHYWRENSAARRLFAEGFDALEGFDVIYFSAITLAILPPLVRDGLLAWLAHCNKTIVFDSNYRPKLWTSVATARASVEAAWRLADIGLPSLEDELALFADLSEQGVVARLRDWGVTKGALKRGALGPRAMGGLEKAHPAAFPKAAAVIDTTAAGDSFNGAFLGSYLQHGDTAKALADGHACALAVIAHKGAIIPAR